MIIHISQLCRKKQSRCFLTQYIWCLYIKRIKDNHHLYLQLSLLITIPYFSHFVFPKNICGTKNAIYLFIPRLNPHLIHTQCPQNPKSEPSDNIQSWGIMDHVCCFLQIVSTLFLPSISPNPQVAAAVIFANCGRTKDYGPRS